MKRVVLILICICLIVSSVAYADNATAELQGMYAEAELLMAQGDYSGAAAKFEALGAYSDASQMTMYCKAIAAAEMMEMYDVAVMTFENLGDFRDSKQMAAYYTARGKEASADKVDTETAGVMELTAALSGYELAEKGYAELALFKDCMTRYANCQTKRVVVEQLIEARKAQAAQEKAEQEARAKEEKYQTALTHEKNEEYFEAIKLYDELADYKDCSERLGKIKEAQYLKAIDLFFEHDYSQAKVIFDQLGEYKNDDYPASNVLAVFCGRDMALPQHVSNLTVLHHSMPFGTRYDSYQCVLHYLNSQGNSFGILTSENYKKELKGSFIAFGQTSGNGPASFIEGYHFDKTGNVRTGLASYMEKIEKNDPTYTCSAEGDRILLTSDKKGKTSYTVARMSMGYYAWFKDGDTNKTPEFFLAKVDKAGKSLAYTFSTDLSAPYEELEDVEAEEETVYPLSVYEDKETIKNVQQKLNDAGYPCGTPDGAAGKKTKTAIASYQNDKGLTVTGTVTHELLVSLGIMN